MSSTWVDVRHNRETGTCEVRIVERATASPVTGSLTGVLGASSSTLEVMAFIPCNVVPSWLLPCSVPWQLPPRDQLVGNAGGDYETLRLLIRGVWTNILGGWSPIEKLAQPTAESISLRLRPMQRIEWFARGFPDTLMHRITHWK